MSRKTQLLEENDGPGWITTFADLMTLLLVFFVLLFSMSSVENEAFEEAARSLNIALSRDSAPSSLIPLLEPAAETTRIPDPNEAAIINRDAELADQMRFQQALVDSINLELEEITQDLQGSLAESDMGSWVEIGTPLDGRLRLKVNAAVMFDPGSVEVRRSMMPLLDSILEVVLENPGFKLEVQGHTDDQPVDTDRFPSNWELSAFRATAVLRFLIEGGLAPQRVVASGYGDSMPLLPNTSEENRAVNRRLEFVLERAELPR